MFFCLTIDQNHIKNLHVVAIILSVSLGIYAPTIKAQEATPFQMTYDWSLAYTMPQPRKIPYDSPHLPVVKNKPSTNLVTSGRVILDIGKSVDINGDGKSTCVEYMQSRGWNIKGDAKEWLTKAREAGYKTSDKPVNGAIVVTNESPWDHVAEVSKMVGDKLVIVEQNVIPNTQTTGTLPIDSPVILGYILPQ